jgi:glucose-6-phosphate isomerase, archaeal
MFDAPFSFELTPPQFIPARYDNHIVRTLKSMKGQYLDQDAYAAQLAQDDRVLYEVYETRRPENSGELLNGVSLIHPGLVGAEYSMTKGHFHQVLDTAEIYFTLSGRGYMVMEDPDGEWAVEPLEPGRVLYVPPRWAHRSVNTSLDEDLIFFFVYPGHAGHDYGTIENQGFRKLVIHTPDGPQIVDNPRWQPVKA